MQSNQPEQQKNLILAIVLSMAVVFGWQYFYAGPKLKEEQAAPLSGAGRVEHGRGRVRFAQAVAGAGCAVTAFAEDAEFPAQVPQRARAARRRFANLTVGHGLADTDIHAAVSIDGT